MIRSYSATEIRSRAASSSSICAAAIRAAAPGATTPEKNSLVQPLPYENSPIRAPASRSAWAWSSPASPR